MLLQLNESSKKVGLKINLNKTKTMSSENTQIVTENHIIENVDQYVYFRQTLKLVKENQRAEINNKKNWVTLDGSWSSKFYLRYTAVLQKNSVQYLYTYLWLCMTMLIEKTRLTKKDTEPWKEEC